MRRLDLGWLWVAGMMTFLRKAVPGTPARRRAGCRRMAIRSCAVPRSVPPGFRRGTRSFPPVVAPDACHPHRRRLSVERVAETPDGQIASFVRPVCPPAERGDARCLPGERQLPVPAVLALVWSNPAAVLARSVAATAKCLRKANFSEVLSRVSVTAASPRFACSPVGRPAAGKHPPDEGFGTRLRRRDRRTEHDHFPGGLAMRAFRLCRRKAWNEKRNADQRPPAGGMPHRHR